MSAQAFYTDDLSNPLSTTFRAFGFGAQLQNIDIRNDDPSSPIYFSYNGTVIHGKLNPKDLFTIENGNLSSIYVKGTNGGEKYRIFASNFQ